MSQSFYEDIGQKIQMIRRNRKISQKELAKLMNKSSPTYVALIESGKRRVSVESLTKIAQALGVSMNAFLDKHYDAHDADSLLNLALVSDQKLTPKQRTMVVQFIHFLRERST